MVLEHLYPLKLIERNPFYAFILGLAYTIIGIGISVILFPEDPAVFGIAFIAIMVYPTINTLMGIEEEIESKIERFSVLGFFRDHQDIFKVYTLLFLGFLLGFSLFSLAMPQMATNHIFENQVSVMYGRTTGNAVNFSLPLFKSLFINNLGVLVLCFITALLIGDGAILLIIWNASVWGTIFGVLAKTAALNATKNPFYYFFLVLLIVFPHMILEAFSYMSSATAGGIVSKALLKEQAFSARFNEVMKDTLILFLFSLIILVIAVLVETYVLGNVEIYQTIIRQSRL